MHPPRPVRHHRPSRPDHVGARRPRRRLPAVVATVVVTLVAALGAAVTTPAGASSTPAGWTKVWSDDFTGPPGVGVDTANWLYSLGHGYPGGAHNWGTGEVETMVSSTDNVYLDGQGHLAIKPIRDAAGNWTSGRIETQRTDFAAPAGGKLRVEASIRQPAVSGAEAAGYWPAFWMLGDAARPVGATNWPSIGEIDIMEDVNGLSSVFGTLHCGTVSGGPCNETVGKGSGQRPCPGCQTAFHTFAMELDRSTSPEQIRWYLDGDNYFTLSQSEVDATAWANATHRGFFLILNVAMGGAFPAALGSPLPTAATKSGVPMYVDYVAVYTAHGPGTSSPTTSPTSSAGSGGFDATARIEAEDHSGQSGTGTEPTPDTGGGRNVGWIGNGDWLRFDDVDFGATPLTQFQARGASGAGANRSGLVEVRLDSRTSAPVSRFEIGDTGGWQSWRTVPANMRGITGRHTVYLTFTSGQPDDFVNVNWVTFGR